MSDIETLAGTLPDGHVAERLGLQPSEVERWRGVHDIPPFLPPPPRAAEPVARAENAAAPLASPSRKTVVRRRANASAEVAAERGRLPAASSAEPEPRSGARGGGGTGLEGVRDRLGQVSDAALAAETGVHRAAVGAYRRSLGIPAYTGFLFAPGQKRRGRTSALDGFADRIGVEPDAVIAVLAGVSRAAVATWRRRHGVAPPGARRPGRKPSEAATSLDGFADQMGRVSDDEIAAHAGATRSQVAAFRRKHQIPAWQGFRTAPRRRKAARRDVVESTPRRESPRVGREPPLREVTRERERPGRPAVGLRAYTIVATSNAGPRAFIAIGEDLAAACRQAEHALCAHRWTVAGTDRPSAR